MTVDQITLDQIENMYVTPKQMAIECGVFPAAIYRIALVAKIDTARVLGKMVFYSADIPKMQRVAAEIVKDAAAAQALRKGGA